jgi:hypothetical protein
MWQVCLGKKRNAYKILVGTPEGKRQYKNLCIAGRTGIKWALKRLGQRGWTGVIWLSIGTGVMQM